VEEVTVTPEALLLRLEAVERELAAFRDRDGQHDSGAAPPPSLVTGWVGFLSSFVTALLPAAPPGDSKGKDSTGSS
jgi:hypothetical protein